MADWDTVRKIALADEHLKMLKTREARSQGLLVEEAEEIEDARRRLLEDRVPLPPREWIENPYFSGELATDIYDVIKDHFCEIYEQQVFEVILRGSIGWGKTWLAAAIHMYSLYLLSCYGVPQKAFRRMASTAQILYMSLNITKEKAKSSYFREFRQMLLTAPYFVKDGDFPIYLPNTLVNEIRFPQKNIGIKFAGASKTAAESENLIFAVLDEANLYDVVDKSRRADPGQERYDEAETVYNSATIRMMTRYMLPNGDMPLPCKVIVLCRETVPDSFTDRKSTEAKSKKYDVPDVKGRVRTKIYMHSEWETKPADFYEKDDVFWVVLPTRTQSAQVIEDRHIADEVRKNANLMRAAGAEESEIQIVKECPRAGGRWVDKAIADPLEFIRQVIGVPTQGTDMLFEDKSIIFAAHRKPDPPLVPLEVCVHPYSQESTNFHDGAFLQKHLLARPIDPEDPDSDWEPLHKPDAPRFIGMDSSISGTSSAFCMVGLDGFVQRLRMKPGQVKQLQEEELDAIRMMAPLLWQDLILEIPPPPGGEVPVDAILDLIDTLSGMGFAIHMVGFDTYERTAVSQPLEKLGYDWEIVSTDKSTTPNLWTKRAYKEHRIRTYPYGPLEDQLGGLQRYNDGTVKDGQPVEKIVKGPGKAKDVTDAQARAVFLAETYAENAIETGEGYAAGRGGDQEPKGKRELEKVELMKAGNMEKLYDVMKKEEDEEY